MRNRFVATGLLIPALCLIVLTACAQLGAGPGGSPTLNRILSKQELRVGTAGNMPPLNMTTRDGNVIGLISNRLTGQCRITSSPENCPRRISRLISSAHFGSNDKSASPLALSSSKPSQGSSGVSPQS